MREEDVKDLSQFLQEFQSETDRGAALVGAALIDLRLSETLKAFFVDCSSSRALLKDGVEGALGAFGSRTLACHALGLIDDAEKETCNLIAKIRNQFAHKAHGTSFDTQAIKDHCGRFKVSLPGDPKDFKNKPRALFINAVVLTAVGLTYRAEWVAKERRISKSWP